MNYQSENEYVLRKYLAALLYNYSIESPHVVSNTCFSDFVGLPMSLSERLFAMVSGQKAKQIPKQCIINFTMFIFQSVYTRNLNFLFDFFDIGRKKAIVKTDMIYLARNFYVFYNNSFKGFEDLANEICSMFQHGKILLQKEFFLLEEKFHPLLDLLFSYFRRIKILDNFSYFHNNLIILNKNSIILNTSNKFPFDLDKNDENLTRENSFNTSFDNLSSIAQDFDNSEMKRKNSFSFGETSKYQKKIGFEKIKQANKKQSFQCEIAMQSRKELDDPESPKSFDFFCSINEGFFEYKFVVYNGIIFYFEFCEEAKQHVFKGALPINSTTHLTKIEDSERMFHASIEQYINFETISIEIYSYSRKVFLDFGQEILSHSHFEKFKRNFELKEEIGRGTFSKVYKCQNLKTNEVNAVKIIDKENIVEDPGKVEMIYWEKNILEYIKKNPNKNVVGVISIYESTYKLYFIYEYLEKGPIRDVNKDAIIGISNGLRYFHKNNILHRDIKAENILVSRADEVKIIDFGLGKFQSKLQKSFESFGSLCYIAPELLEDKGYGDECDVWSFGITLHYLKYKDFPFDDPNDNSGLIRKKITEENYHPKGNTPLDRIISRCLERNQNKRIKAKNISALAEEMPS